MDHKPCLWSHDVPKHPTLVECDLLMQAAKGENVNRGLAEFALSISLCEKCAEILVRKLLHH